MKKGQEQKQHECECPCHKPPFGNPPTVGCGGLCWHSYPQ